jgi:hypothetical protein
MMKSISWNKEWSFSPLETTKVGWLIFSPACVQLSEEGNEASIRAT